MVERTILKALSVSNSMSFTFLCTVIGSARIIVRGSRAKDHYLKVLCGRVNNVSSNITSSLKLFSENSRGKSAEGLYCLSCIRL